MDQIIRESVSECVSSDRTELQTLNAFLLLLLIKWKRIHNHLGEKSIFNGNTLWPDSWSFSCSYRLLATTGRQKTDQFSAPNGKADWFLACWNSFQWLLCPQVADSGLFQSKLTCYERSCPVTRVHLQHVWWYRPIFPTRLCPREMRPNCQLQCQLPLPNSN